MKYDPLKHFLEGCGKAEVQLSFEQIEHILGDALPASARKHPAWWSNNATNHVNAEAWLAAGYVSEQLDLGAERVVFARRQPGRDLPSGFGEEPTSRLGRPTPGVLERLRASLGGTVRVAPGVDLTLPTGEVWNAERE